jgi:hypothetical protein
LFHAFGPTQLRLSGQYGNHWTTLQTILLLLESLVSTAL